MTPSDRTGVKLVGVALLMASLSFAAVPFYNWFCKVTGFAGTPLVAKAAPDHVLDQTIRVRFDGSTAPGMPWQFKPSVTTMDVKLGENALAFFEAYNPTDRVVAGTASYNISPDSAGGFFSKIACFCFTEQILQPGERVEMPVSFFVDPEIINDPEAKYVREITLSYTFYETELTPEQAALAVPATSALN